MKKYLSERFRRRRDVLLRSLIEACPRREETLRILDVGGRPEYWGRVGYQFLAERNVRITLLNLDLTEMSDRNTGAGDLFEYVVGNGCCLDYPDNHFDFCHSNSVIEHVGLWRDMQAFAREARRVASTHYVQTPNFWFPIDPHFWRFPLYHWFPRPIRAQLLKTFPLATAGRAPDTATAYSFVDSSRLLSKDQMRALFPDSEMRAERLFLLAKSYIAISSSRTPRVSST